MTDLYTYVDFQAACESFGVDDEAASKVVSASLKNMSTGWSPGLYRWVEERKKPSDLCSSKYIYYMAGSSSEQDEINPVF